MLEICDGSLSTLGLPRGAGNHQSNLNPVEQKIWQMGAMPSGLGCSQKVPFP